MALHRMLGRNVSVETVAQRSRTVSYGRALFPEGLPGPQVQGTEGRNPPRPGGEAFRNLSRFPIRRNPARRGRLGWSGVPLGISDSQFPASGQLDSFASDLAWYVRCAERAHLQLCSAKVGLS